MITTMLVDRETDWFIYEDTKLDPYYFAIQVLEKLSTRQKVGLKYKRINIIQLLVNKNGEEALKSLDKAIVLLLSRKLIDIKNDSNMTSTIFITEHGLEALKTYRKELKK